MALVLAHCPEGGQLTQPFHPVIALQTQLSRKNSQLYQLQVIVNGFHSNAVPKESDQPMSAWNSSAIHALWRELSGPTSLTIFSMGYF